MRIAARLVILLPVGLAMAACRSGGASAADAGSCSPVAISTAADSPRWFALDGANAYWTASDGYSNTSTIRQAPRCGGGPTTVYQGTAKPTSLLVDGPALFFADGLTPGNLTRVDLVSGSAVMLAAESSPVTEMALDEQSVFWIDGNTLRTVPRNGGTVADLIPALTLPNGLAAADSSLFWVDRGNEMSPGRVLTAPKNGGQPSELAPGENYVGGDVGVAAVDASSVYFGGWLGEVSAVSRTGGGVVTLADSQAPVVIAAHNGFVYWINDTIQADSSVRGLWRAPTGGGIVEALDSSAVGDTIAFDSGDVFYLTPGAIAVRPE